MKLNDPQMHALASPTLGLLGGATATAASGDSAASVGAAVLLATPAARRDTAPLDESQLARH